MRYFSRLIVIFAIAVINCAGWKPIAAPSSSFIIRQSPPPIGSPSQVRNSIVGDNSGRSDLSVFDDHRIGNEALLGSSDLSDFQGFKSAASLFSSPGFREDACSVDKYAFDHDGTVHYRHTMPKLEQFTICFWMRFTNHTGDHTLFTYADDDEPREIQIWVANSKGSSYISMAIHGQSLYRLNYPLKMRVWHHHCSSWNGKTGEWQAWLKAERIGRGFHNRLVKHDIPANGVLFSGGPSTTGATAIGLHFEITLLQIYKVALTAGKAHRDHKHHHVHHFNHDGPAPTTTPPPPTRIAQMMNPLLANGQIANRVRINLAGSQQQPGAQSQASVLGVPSQVVGDFLQGLPPQPLSNQAIINTNFVNGQFHTAGRLLSQQLVSNSFPQIVQRPQPLLQTTFQSSQTRANQLPANIQLVEEIDSSSRLFKRDNESVSKKVKLIKKRDISELKMDQKEKGIKVRETHSATLDKKINKRGLVMLGDGSVVDDTLLAHGYKFEGLAQFGLPSFQENLKSHMDIEDEIKEHDKEPAEDEVKAVMGLCTSCDEEPFRGAAIFEWKKVVVTSEQTLKGRSVGGCGFF